MTVGDKKARRGDWFFFVLFFGLVWFGNVLLALVNLDVPLPPDLGGGEHATGTAHVTEGSLTGTVSTTTGDTGNTGDGAT